MTKHRFEIEIVLNDEAVAEHDADAAPPPRDPGDWDARDIFLAVDRGFFDPADDVEIVNYEQVIEGAEGG